MCMELGKRRPGVREEWSDVNPFVYSIVYNKKLQPHLPPPLFFPPAHPPITWVSAQLLAKCAIWPEMVVASLQHTTRAIENPA